MGGDGVDGGGEGTGVDAEARDGAVARPTEADRQCGSIARYWTMVEARVVEGSPNALGAGAKSPLVELPLVSVVGMYWCASSPWLASSRLTPTYHVFIYILITLFVASGL